MRPARWLPKIDRSPEAMTNRARGYMGVVAARHLLVAAGILAAPQRFQAPTFQTMADTVPLPVWAAASLLIGLVAGYGGVCRRETAARVGLIASSTLSGLIAIALAIAIFQSPVAGLMGAIIFASVTAKDLIVCQDPIRAPFQALTRREAPTAPEE